MADDTRKTPPEDLSKEALTVDPLYKPFSGAQWNDSKTQQQQQPFKPPENANLMAGGTQHTAGGKIPEVTLSNAFEGGLKWSDFTDLPKKPCVRDSLLLGIAAGFAVGGLRAIFRAPASTASNWASGSFCASSAGMYTYCSFKRQNEKDGMMRAMEIINKKELEKKARESRKEKIREERREAKEKEQDAHFAALREKEDGKGGGGGGKSWWKLW